MEIVRVCLHGNCFLFNGDRVTFLLVRIGGTLATIALASVQWYIQDLTAGVSPLMESDCQRLSDVIWCYIV